MEEKKSIQVTFGLDEIALYNIIQRYCIDKNIEIPDYIKEVIKKDLAWGHLTRRKKSGKEKTG
ncbi:MAG: hypothetical protein EHM28_11980 [Spirochaetaceae bacterium]|nr:MAG: hypothetical protein EHM28_11980 [Spirochaetaceae bacterium]